MAFLCIGCFKNHNINIIPSNWICQCGDTIIPIDDMMVLPIKQLNELNLRTMYCCSGHPVNDDCIVPYVMISLTDSFVLPEYLSKMNGNTIYRDIFVPDDIETFVEHISNGNNFKEIYDHFNDAGFDVELCYNSEQYKLRMTLRYSTLTNDGMVGLNFSMNEQIYQEWLSYNYKFYEYTKSCPMVVNYA